MKILAIGDPHGDLEKIKKIPMENVDLILLPGDVGSASIARKRAFDNISRKKKGLGEIEYTDVMKKRAYMEIYNSTMKILKFLSKYSPVYFIYGNVEEGGEKTFRKLKRKGIKVSDMKKGVMKLKNVKIINNKVVKFEGLSIGGIKYFTDVNWVEDFSPDDKKKLNESKKEREKHRKILNKMKKLDVLIIHQPPYGILDKVDFDEAPKHWQGKHAGSKLFLSYIKREQPKYVFCGHIHEKEDSKKIGKTKVFNLGLCGYRTISF
jgi:Icc-related predicted phosphoesterase